MTLPNCPNCHVVYSSDIINERTAGVCFVSTTTGTLDVTAQVKQSQYPMIPVNLTAFTAGKYSVFSWLDRALKYDIHVEADLQKPHITTRQMIADPSEPKLTTITLHSGETWLNEYGYDVVLLFVRSVPLMQQVGDYWQTVYDSNDDNPPFCNLIQGGRSSAIIGVKAGDVFEYYGTDDPNGFAEFSVYKGQVITETFPDVRMYGFLIDGTRVECLVYAKKWTGECECKMFPALWRTVGLSGEYTDSTGKSYERGEYVFVDPLFPDIGYSPYTFKPMGDEKSGFINSKHASTEGGINTPCGYTYHYVIPELRNEHVGALHPPSADDIMSAVAPATCGNRINPDKLEAAAKHKRIPSSLIEAYLKGEKTLDDLWLSQESGDILSYDSISDEGAPIGYTSAVADYLVKRYCDDKTNGDLVMGRVPLFWFRRSFIPGGYSVVFDGDKVVAKVDYPCVGAYESNNSCVLVGLEHAGEDPMMTELATFNYFIMEPRKERATMEYNGMGYGGNGLNGLYPQAGGISYGIANEHYTFASLTPYVPNPFGNSVSASDFDATPQYIPEQVSNVPDNVKPDTRDMKVTGTYLGRHPSYLMILVNPNGSVNKNPYNTTDLSERNTDITNSFNVSIFRINDCEAPVSFDAARCWREPYDTGGVQASHPLSGGVHPFHGGIQGYGIKGRTSAMILEQRYLQDSALGNQFNFIRSKPLMSDNGVVVAGANGCLLVSDGSGVISEFDVENLRRMPRRFS